MTAFNFNSDSGTTVDNLTNSNDGTSANVTFEYGNTTSNRLKDQTSNNYHGGAVSVISESNNWGRSADLDGSTGYITLPVGLGRTATQDVTREFWLKVDDFPGSGSKDTFFYCGDMFANQYYETISVHPDGTLQYQERAGNSSTTGINSGNGLSTNFSNILLSENAWYHVVYTISGGTKKIYINGGLQVSDTVTDTKVNNSTYPATIGAFRGAYASAFHGEVAQFRSYTSALTDAQIKANYDATRAQFFSALTHSLVSVNDKAGFSIAKYEGTGAQTDVVEHGLSKTPEISIIKNLSTAASWPVQYFDTLPPNNEKSFGLGNKTNNPAVVGWV